MTMTQTSRISRRARVAVWAPVALRLIVGYGFVAHGMAKLSRGPHVFAGVLQAMGVPQPHLMAWLTIVIELVGGAAVLARSVRPVCERSVGGGPHCGHGESASGLRIQLDQAPRHRPGWCSVRPAGLRDQFALSRVSRDSRPWRSGPRGDRQLHRQPTSTNARQRSRLTRSISIRSNVRRRHYVVWVTSGVWWRW